MCVEQQSNSKFSKKFGNQAIYGYFNLITINVDL